MAELGVGIQIRAPILGRYADVVTHEALNFVASLHRTFNPRRNELLAARADRQRSLDSGEQPNFLSKTRHLRETEWTVDPLPNDLLDRRVEIPGPVDCKTIIDALNSGAKVFVADFEDSAVPTWANLVEGQINLYDAIRRTIVFRDDDTGKSYKLNENAAALFVRPRGLHMEDAEAGTLALTHYKKACGLWATMAERAKGIYMSDVSYGDIPQRHGHRMVRIPALDSDVAAMEKKIARRVQTQNQLMQLSRRSNSVLYDDGVNAQNRNVIPPRRGIANNLLLLLIELSVGDCSLVPRC